MFKDIFCFYLCFYLFIASDKKLFNGLIFLHFPQFYETLKQKWK